MMKQLYGQSYFKGEENSLLAYEKFLRKCEDKYKSFNILRAVVKPITHLNTVDSAWCIRLEVEEW